LTPPPIEADNMMTVSFLELAIARELDEVIRFMPRGEWFTESLLSDEFVEEEFAGFVRRAFHKEPNEDLDPFDGALDPGRHDRLADEALVQRLVLVRGAGTSRAPAWDISLVVMSSPDVPEIAAEIRRLRRGRELTSEAFPHEPPGLVDGVDDPEATLWESTRLEPLDWPAGSPLEWPDLATVDDSTVRSSSKYMQLVLDQFGPDYDADQDANTFHRLISWFGRDGILGDGPLGLNDELRRAAQQLSTEATDLYAAVLLDAPALQLGVGPAEAWITRSAPGWHCVFAGNKSMSLDSLSDTQRRWARWAIAEALRNRSLGDKVGEEPLLVVFDEPEAGLHRSAESHMARGLSRLAHQPGKIVIVATHSPDLLDDPDASVIEVRRRPDGTGFIAPLRALDREQLESFGLQPSDLLRRQRSFVLVEGEHDEIVIGTLIGEQLRQHRAYVVALRGGANLEASLDSRVLYDFTDAQLIAVLDNIQAEHVRSVWSDVQARYLADGADAAINELRISYPDTSGEARWIKEWLGRALRNGMSGRIEPYGFTKQDVIGYLPVGALVPGDIADWTELRTEYDAWSAQAARNTLNFKGWLRRHKRAKISAHTIREAAESMDHIPDEFIDLVRLAEGVARSARHE
jgi:hypothetical protein